MKWYRANDATCRVYPPPLKSGSPLGRQVKVGPMSIAYQSDPGLRVAAGDKGYILTSPDGINRKKGTA